MDINTCTDVYTHSTQGVAMEMGDKHTNSATQGHPWFHVTMQRGWNWHGKSGGYEYMYWCKYTC